MVPAWLAAAAWLVAWSVLARISVNLLQKVRPGETVPMRRRPDGSGAWRVSPVLAAVFTPALATLVGLVTIGVGFLYGRGQAPLMNVLLPAVFVAAHWMHVSTAIKLLEQERR